MNANTSQKERVVRVQTQTVEARDDTESDSLIAREVAEAELEAQRMRAAQAAAGQPYGYDSQEPYYYGVWRAPPGRPVIVYREDPAITLWACWCFLFWMLVFLAAILLIIYLK